MSISLDTAKTHKIYTIPNIYATTLRLFSVKMILHLGYRVSIISEDPHYLALICFTHAEIIILEKLNTFSIGNVGSREM